MKTSVGWARSGAYDGACWTVSSFFWRRVVDSWRHWTRGRSDDCRAVVPIRTAVLHVDILEECVGADARCECAAMVLIVLGMGGKIWSGLAAPAGATLIGQCLLTDVHYQNVEHWATRLAHGRLGALLYESVLGILQFYLCKFRYCTFYAI